MLGPVVPTSWQNALVGYLCGLMAAVYPGPAGVVATVWAVAFVRGRELVILAVCLGFGLAVGLDRERAEPLSWPGKRTVHVAGRIESARTFLDAATCAWWSRTPLIWTPDSPCRPKCYGTGTIRRSFRERGNVSRPSLFCAP